jgi:TonB family protein
LSQLADLLTALPAPVQVSAVGGVSHPYLAGVQRKIEQNWRPTTENPRQSVVVRFTIQRDGTATNIAVATSSGDPVLDNQAVRAVTVSSPFGPWPPGIFTGNTLEILCTLRPTRRGGR